MSYASKQYNVTFEQDKWKLLVKTNSRDETELIFKNLNFDWCVFCHGHPQKKQSKGNTSSASE